MYKGVASKFAAENSVPLINIDIEIYQSGGFIAADHSVYQDLCECAAYDAIAVSYRSAALSRGK